MRMITPVQPGRFPRGVNIEAYGLSVTDAAKILRVSRPTLSSLLNAKADLSGEMALRFEKAFGVDMDTFMRMQNSYDIAQRGNRHSGNVATPRYFRDGFAMESVQKLLSRLLQFRPPPAYGKTENSKENLAANNRAGDDTVSFVQSEHPLLHSRIRPHQSADGVRIQQVCHGFVYLSNGPLPHTGSRAAAMAASRSSTAEGLG